MVSFLVVAVILTLSNLMSQTVNTYLCIDYFNDVNALSLINMISLPVTLVVAMFTAKLSQKLGKREFSMIGLIIAGVVFLGAYFIKANNSSSYVVVFGLATLGASELIC